MDPRAYESIASIRRPINRCVVVTLALSVGVTMALKGAGLAQIPDESWNLVDQYEL